MEKNQDWARDDLLGLPRHCHGSIIYILKVGLNNPDYTFRLRDIQQRKSQFNKLLNKMEDIGLISKVAPGTYVVNLNMVRRCTYVVTDDLYEKLSDPEYIFNLKKEAGKKRKSRTYESERERWAKKSAKNRERKLKHREKVEIPEPSEDPLAIENVLFPSKS